jgi:SAM-dependent methyltransferase
MDQQIDWQHLFTVDPEAILEEHWSKMVWQCFAKYIPRKGRVVEIGCGTGRIVVQAGKHLSVWGVGIDVNQDALDYARRLSAYLGDEQGYFVQASGFDLPFPDGFFDVVFSEGVIEHFSLTRTETMVREHVRVCKPGGRVVISVPNLLNLPLTYHKLRAGRKFAAYPERSYTVWGLARLLKRCGLRPVAYDGFAPSVSLEWFVLSRLKLYSIDRLIANSSILSSLLGYECVVVGVKGNAA